MCLADIFFLFFFFQILKHVVTLSQNLVSVWLTLDNTIMIQRQKHAKNLYTEAALEMEINLIRPNTAWKSAKDINLQTKRKNMNLSTPKTSIVIILLLLCFNK